MHVFTFGYLLPAVQQRSRGARAAWQWLWWWRWWWWWSQCYRRWCWWGFLAPSRGALLMSHIHGHFAESIVWKIYVAFKSKICHCHCHRQRHRHGEIVNRCGSFNLTKCAALANCDLCTCNRIPVLGFFGSTPVAPLHPPRLCFGSDCPLFMKCWASRI